MPNYHRPFWLLYATTFIIGFGQSMLFSILPPIARATGMDEIQVGAIFAAPSVAFMITGPLWGRASDHWGRKPIILFAAAAYGLSMIIVGVGVQIGLAGAISSTGMFLVLLLSRTFNGVLGSGGQPASQAYIADRTGHGNRVRALAALAAGMSIGTVIGPAAAAFLVLITLHAPFYFVSCCSLIIVMLAWRYLQPDVRHPATFDRPRQRWMSPRDPRIAMFLLMIAANGIALSSVMQTLSLYLMDGLQLEPQTAAMYGGACLAAMGGAQLIVQLVLIPRLRLQPDRLIPMGFVLTACGLALVLLGPALPLLVSGAAVLGLSGGMLGPGLATACSLSVAAHEQGSVAGLMVAVGPIGFIISPITIMPMYKIAPELPYAAVLALVLVMIYLAFKHPRVKELEANLGPHRIDDGEQP